MKKSLLFICFLAALNFSYGQTFSFLKDINPGAGTSSPEWFTACNGKVYFFANDGTGGTQLWISDNTPGGTQKLKQLSTARNANLGGLIVLKKSSSGMVFCFMDTLNMLHVYKTDGTAGGTTLEKTISFTSSIYQVAQGILLNDKWFFNFNDGTHGYEIAYLDMNTYTIVPVKDINPGIEDGLMAHLAIYNNQLYGVARIVKYVNPPTDTVALFKIGTTAATTTLVQKFCKVYFMRLRGNKLYFSGSIPYDNNYSKFYTYDDISNSTTLLSTKDFPIENSLMLNGKIFAASYYYDPLQVLYSLNPANNQVDSITNLNPTNNYNGTPYGGLPGMVLLGNKIICAGNHPYKQVQHFWACDGTPGGCVSLGTKTFGDYYSQTVFYPLGNYVYFKGIDSSKASVFALFKSDGTSAGTVKIADSIDYVTVQDNFVIVIKNFPGYGKELMTWKDSSVASLVPSNSIKISKLNLFPNPVGENATLEFDVVVDAYLNIDLYDLYGRKLKSIMHNRQYNTGHHSEAINFDEGMAKGIYFILIDDGVSTQCLKIVK